MSTSKSEADSRTRTPRRPAARGKWSEKQLLTTDKSVLIDLDLVKLLARPEAWACLEESDKREILALLPPDIHPEAQATLDDPDAKIPPIPDSFVRYSNNWRDGVRQFQIDLQNGRYDPEWLRQAQDARQQRENGDFDDFKEREYEQFWGQKQKVIWNAPAGESARVKMGTLIDEGVIQLGDVWKFYYVYGRGPGRIVIEKEVRVVDRNGVKLTFAIPPGEQVFLRSNFDKSEPFSTPEKVKDDVKADLDTQPQSVTPSCSDKHLKDGEPEPQVTNQTSSGEDGKIDTDEAPQEIPASSNDEGIKLNNGQTPHETPISSTDDMNIDTDTATQLVFSHSNSEGSLQKTPFSVVISSPGGTRNQKPKRTIPEPEPQPPVKRKRGRPRKTLPNQPELEPPKEPDIPREIEVSHGGEQNTNAPLSFMEIVGAKIEENETCRAAAESSQTKPSQPQLHLSVLSSTSEPLAPELSTSAEGPSIADTSGNDGKVELLESFMAQSDMAQSDTPKDSIVAPIEAPAEAEQNEINKPLSTEEQKHPVPTPFQPTASEPDEIIVPNLSSPQALVSKILQIDGRMPNGRTANAWKEIRCYRNNQDMGSLFDVREAWFLQHG